MSRYDLEPLDLSGLRTTSIHIRGGKVRAADLARPYHTLGYPVVPLLFFAGAAILLTSTLLERRRESLMGLGLMAAGLPFYFYWKHARR